MPDNLQQIADLLNNHSDYWAKLITARHDPIQREDYLIIFARRHAEVIHQLVLMGDYSVTWRPFKPTDTPAYCQINIDDPTIAAKHMMTLADAWDKNQLPREVEEGEGTGQHLLTDNP